MLGTRLACLGGGDPVEGGDGAEGGEDVAGRREHGLVQRRQQRAEDDQPRRRQDVRQRACGAAASYSAKGV